MPFFSFLISYFFPSPTIHHSGAFSDVYRATRISDKLVVAVKQIKKYKVKNKADIETEVAILKKWVGIG